MSYKALTFPSLTLPIIWLYLELLKTKPNLMTISYNLSKTNPYSDADLQEFKISSTLSCCMI